MCVDAGILSHSVSLKCACRDPHHRPQFQKHEGDFCLWKEKKHKRDATFPVASCTVASNTLSQAQYVLNMQYAAEADTNLQWSRTCPVDGRTAHGNVGHQR